MALQCAGSLRKSSASPRRSKTCFCLPCSSFFLRKTVVLVRHGSGSSSVSSSQFLAVQLKSV